MSINGFQYLVFKLVAKGDASPVNVKPQSLRLAPGAHVSVKIDCICEIVGEFEITGYRVDLYGLIYEVHFDRLLKKRKVCKISNLHYSSF